MSSFVGTALTLVISLFLQALITLRLCRLRCNCGAVLETTAASSLS